MSWSVLVRSPAEVAGALAGPGDALDLRAHGELDPVWSALGFTELAPGELVRPLPQLLTGVSATRALGARLAAELRAGDLVVLSGPLGAGKTALVQGLGAALGVQGAVTSPTFVIARVHRGPLPLVHVDAYRLGGSAGRLELDDLDLDADLPDSVVAVEWGEDLAEALSDSHLHVALQRARDEDVRTALVTPYGPRWTLGRAGHGSDTSHAASTRNRLG